jgi:AcrR family transcriptional regulator
MVRITKEYDERLTEFLDTAQQLFFEKGYEKTSVNDIIEKIGVAKGTFYHYFKTKSDLLDKLVQRFAERIKSEITNLVERTDLNAIEKLNGVFALGRTIKAENIELMKLLLKVLYNDDNLMLRHKIIRSRIKITTPEFVKILKQGNEEGFFNVDDSGEVAELIFLLGAHLNEIVGELILKANDNPEIVEEINRKIKAYERSVEKILGIAPDSITVADREYIKLFQLESNNKKDG